MYNRTEKIKISLFPYNHEANIMCRFKKELVDFDIHAVISYRGNRLDDTNLQEGISYTDDAKSALSASQGIVLCDNVQKLGKKAYLNRLEDTADCNKPVYISSYLYNWLGEESFRNNEVIVLNDYIEKNVHSSTSLLEIGCPVISILGMGENCDKFALLLSTRRCLKNKGYKVLAISANPLAKLMDCEVFPAYLFESNLSIVEKTIKINHYIHELVKNQDPDIVLISHASGFITLNEYEYNYFGEISYILSNAVVSDYGILCAYYEKNYTKEYFEDLKTLCKMRLGIDVLWFYVSNQTYRTNVEFKKIDYHFYNKKFCEENFPLDLQNERRILTLEHADRMESVVDEIISLLSGSPEII